LSLGIAMADIINLNRAKKARSKADEKAAASANRAKFGRTTAEKDADRMSAEAIARHVDAHKRDNDRS
jgi:hypothetical protein